MGRHRIYCRLSEQSFKDAAEKVANYQKELNKKCFVFVSRLSEEGINVANQNLGNYGKYIVVSKKINQNNIESIICMTNTGLIKSQWENQDGIQEVDISPILMCEFGSGNYAENPNNIPGVGQGSLNTMGHAYDPNGWWYKKLDGTWHFSRGTYPNQPLFKAVDKMYKQVSVIAKQVFG